MARYLLTADDYRLGPAGAIVDLDADLAAWYNRDRHIVLLVPVPEEAERALPAPPQDRQVRAPRRKRGRSGGNP